MSDKQTVIRELEAALREFKDTVAPLTDAQLAKPVFDQWSVREIAAHIGGWHDQLTTGVERIARGERPSPEGADWGNVDGWNERLTAEIPGTAREVIAGLDAKVDRMIAALRSVPDDRFGEGKTVNRLADGAGIHHFHEHAEHIRAALAEGRL